jgi:ABC-type transport system involved in multi-copper enzyme maturation permease subunit
MHARILAIALNTYREAVRARILWGLAGAALFTAVFSLFIATLSLHQETRVIADIGAASTSLYAVVTAIVLGALSLYEEIEHKTVFPILSRSLRRHEYLLGKYLGVLVLLSVFVAVDAAAVLLLLAGFVSPAPWKILVVAALLVAILGVTLMRARLTRAYVFVPWAYALFLCAALLAGGMDERRMIVASAVLTMCEVAIVAAVAMLFSSFSSPFLTAVFTLLLFVIGRSADTMGHIPARVYGETLAGTCAALAHAVPNLNLYVPTRGLLLGQDAAHPLWPYVGSSAMYAFFYTTVLLTLSALVFRKRDFL